MRFLSTVAFTLLALATVCNTAEINHVKHESLTQLPHGWTLHSNAAHDIQLTYRIAVKQNEFGLKQLEQYVLEHSSNPESSRFSHHLTRSEINRMVAPHQHSVDAVVQWLTSHGIEHSSLEHSDGSDWISFKAPISIGNKLLKAEYKVYEHSSGHKVIRATEYHVPEHIVEHIDFVSPTTRFPHAPKLNSRPVINGVDSTGKYHPLNALKTDAVGPILGQQVPVDINGLTCNQLVTPNCRRTQYETNTYTPTAPNNKLGVTGYLGQFWNSQNLQAALASFTVPFFGPNALNAVNNVTNTGDGGDPQGEANAGAEADLDIQTTVQDAYGVPVTFYSTSGLQPYDNPNTNGGPDDTQNEPYADWLATVLGDPNVPQVISTSYGDDEDVVGINYGARVCDEMMELTAQGVTILFASGDAGVQGALGSTDCHGPQDNQFEPSFPNNCPWVTNVGATTINTDGSETAVSDPTIPGYYSGGGFSNRFPRPAWQDAAVEKYLQYQGSEYAGLFNASGRAYPDVSAVGVNFAVYIGQSQLTGVALPNGTDNAPLLFRIDGTSASTPTFASVIALLNDYRLSNGLNPLGFINPAIYSSNGIGFYDVTTGNNPGCGTNGFNATTGWDPVTGWGTPRFQSLLGYLGTLGTPQPIYNDTPFPAGAFSDPPSTTAPVTTSPATTAAPTTSTTATGSRYVCSPGADLTGVSGTPGVTTTSTGNADFTLVTVTNPGVSLTGVAGCCLYGSTANCFV